MRKWTLACVVALALVGSAAQAGADTILGSGGATWQTWSAALLNEDGAPYFDGDSTDGFGQGIGYYLTNTGAFVGGTGPGALDFWGASLLANGYDDNFYVQKTQVGQLAALKIEIAGNANYNRFGWFETNSTGTAVIGGLNEIFSGPASAGASATFTPTAFYGFYLEALDNSVYYTLASQQASDLRLQHFAVFREAPNTYWVGVEDLPFAVSDKDYNDLVVRVTTVPEPGSMLLLGTGLFGLAGYARRRFKK